MARSWEYDHEEVYRRLRSLEGDMKIANTNIAVLTTRVAMWAGVGGMLGGAVVAALVKVVFK